MTGGIIYEGIGRLQSGERERLDYGRWNEVLG